MTTPGFFEVFPDARPALPAGEYELATDQLLAAGPPDGDTIDVDVPGTDVHFEIVSPRYELPPDQLLSTFPPAGAVGDWSQRLPQVVCKRRTLPWERNPTGEDPDSAPPWLALVVLAEGEGTLSGDTAVADCVTSGKVLEGTSDTETGRYLEVTNSVLQAVFPTAADLARLAHVRRVDLRDTELALGDDDGYMAVIMANRLPQPGPPSESGGRPTSRNYTAYLINVEEQVGTLPDDDPDNVEPDFVTVMTELVAPMLVALAPEAQPDDIVMKPGSTNPIIVPVLGALDTEEAVDAEEAVVRDDTEPPEPPEPTARKLDEPAAYSRAYGTRIRRTTDSGWATGPARSSREATTDDAAKRWITGEPLTYNAELAEVYEWHLLEPTFRFPVLLSWDFVCTGDGTFESLMNDLDTAMLGTVDEAPTAPEIAPTGHIALDHTTRRGEPATAWYRGPFVPLPTERTGPDGDGRLPIAHSADEIRPVIPDGREDVGRAAAFEIGRLLALSKPGIVAAMTAWREELFGASRAARLADEVSTLPGAATALTAGGRRLEELLASELVLPYAERARERIGPRMSEVATSRPPEMLDGLEPLAVLDGLGVDPGQVDEAVAEAGLAGWAAVAPREVDDDAPLLSRDAALVERLRTTIENDVELRAGEALRLDTGNAGAGPTGHPDAADVLDALLDRRSGDGRTQP